MDYLKIALKCPYCPDNKSAHVFKTYHGLYRHVWKWHVLDNKRNHPWEISIGSREVNCIRVYLVKYSKYYDIPVKGPKHVDALIEELVKGFNPSLRGTKNG